MSQEPTDNDIKTAVNFARSFPRFDDPQFLESHEKWIQHVASTVAAERAELEKELAFYKNGTQIKEVHFDEEQRFKKDAEIAELKESLRREREWTNNLYEAIRGQTEAMPKHTISWMWTIRKEFESYQKDASEK